MVATADMKSYFIKVRVGTGIGSAARPEKHSMLSKGINYIISRVDVALRNTVYDTASTTQEGGMLNNSDDWTDIVQPKKMIEPLKPRGGSFLLPFMVAIGLCVGIAALCMWLTPVHP
jgi:hypothetical protein